MSVIEYFMILNLRSFFALVWPLYCQAVWTVESETREHANTTILQ